MDKLKCLFFMFLLCFIGCSNVQIIDDVKEGHPKGFVKFTIEASPKNSLLGNIRIQDGNTTKYINTLTKLKVAKPPGDHFFYAVLGTAMEGISVSIIDGMLTPVKIVYLRTAIYSRRADDFYGKKIHSTVHFKLSVLIDKPRPLTAED